MISKWNILGWLPLIMFLVVWFVYNQSMIVWAVGLFAVSYLYYKWFKYCMKKQEKEVEK